MTNHRQITHNIIEIGEIAFHFNPDFIRHVLELNDKRRSELHLLLVTWWGTLGTVGFVGYLLWTDYYVVSVEQYLFLVTYQRMGSNLRGNELLFSFYSGAMDENRKENYTDHEER